MTADPFRHVPELKGQLTPLSHTRFRGDLPAEIRAMQAKAGRDRPVITPDAEREAARAAFLSGHRGDLWVFAYGSLIWDPGVELVELRRATVTGFARHMCLYDCDGGRGSPEAPGLIAGLDHAPGETCAGTVFRIAAEDLEAETRFLWAREQLFPAYTPTILPTDTPQGSVAALAFVVNPDHPMVRRDLPEAEQARLIATGYGDLGSSYDYVAGILGKFRLLGITDPILERLFDRATALRPPQP